MEPESPHETLDKTAWLVASGTFEIILAAKLLWEALANRREIRNFWLRGTRCFGWLARALRRPKASDRPDAEELAVRKEVEKLRLSIARRYSKILTGISLVIVLMVQWNVVWNRPRWMTVPLTWLLFYAFATMVFQQLHPRILSVSTLDFWYLQGSAVVAAMVWPPFVAAEHLTTIAPIMLVLYRLPSAIMVQHSCVIILTNLSMVCMTWVRVRTTLEEDREFVAIAVQAEVVCSMMVIALSFMMRSALHRFAEQFVKSNKATTELNAATALLQLTCDAVLELHPDLKIGTCSPELTTMLLRAPGNLGSVTGLSFTDLVASPEDKERAAHILLSNSRHLAEQAETVSAKAFHTRLVDGCGSKFRTEVFQVSYRRPDDDKIYHLIGLRDFTDQASLAISAVDAVRESQPQATDAHLLHDTNLPMAVAEYASPRILLLELDIPFLQVVAASAPLGFLAGSSLDSIFAGTVVQDLKQLWGELLQMEARGELSRTGRSLSFGKLDMRVSSKKAVQINAAIEVTTTALRELEMFLCFPMSPSVSHMIRNPRRSRNSAHSTAPSDSDSLTTVDNVGGRQASVCSL